MTQKRKQRNSKRHAAKLQRRAQKHNDTGASRYAAGNVTEAMQSFNRAILLDANLASAYTNRGVFHADEGNYDSAIADHDKAISLDANLARA